MERDRKMSKHKNRKTKNTVERVQHAIKDKPDTAMAAEQIQRAMKDQPDTPLAPEQMQQVTKDQPDTLLASEQIQQTTKDQASEQIQQATKDQSNTAMTPVNILATSIQAIATAHSDYTNKVTQNGFDFLAKLTKLKEPTKVAELQSEYVKNTYEMFVVESKNFSELYADLFKQITKPLEALVVKKNAA